MPAIDFLRDALLTRMRLPSDPGMFGDVIKALKPLMDMWGLLFQALGPSECYGIKGFTSKCKR
eukprot:SAG22_NODE_4708_length_1185_cov_1.369245_2_plen_63_part_00